MTRVLIDTADAAARNTDRGRGEQAPEATNALSSFGRNSTQVRTDVRFRAEPPIDGRTCKGSSGSNPGWIKVAPRRAAHGAYRPILMSLVTPPPSGSVKSGKAARYSDYPANPRPVHYLHETPPAQAVGTALALELLGEFDANRQGEHFRRVERAAAYYAGSILNGPSPSIKSIQLASGLSWADTKFLVVDHYSDVWFLSTNVASSSPRPTLTAQSARRLHSRWTGPRRETHRYHPRGLHGDLTSQTRQSADRA